MKKIVFKHIILLLCSILLVQGVVYSQTIPQGFNYQTTIRNSAGIVLIGQTVSLRFSFYSNSPTGTLIWQESSIVISDNYGHVKTIIGNGISTGAGIVSSFSQINWSGGIYYLKISLDTTGGSSYTDVGTTQLFSVPYSLHSFKTKTTNNLSLPELDDVDVLGSTVDNLLKWNGSYWISSVDKDSDSVSYAMNASHSITSDSSYYVFGATTSDTTLFSYQSDSSIYSNSSLNAVSANSSTYSDTATYVFSSSPTAWQLTGNAIGASASFLGNNDSVNLIFKTNSIIAGTLKNNGQLNIGISSNNSSLGLFHNDGLVSIGTMGSSFVPVSGAGTKMIWYPARGVFRAGYIDNNQWDTANIGVYSMAAGYNNIARKWSFSSGYENQALDCSITLGRKNAALGAGIYPEGGCVAIGDSNTAAYRRTVAIGKNSIASGSAAVAIGYNNNASATTSISIGSFCTSSGTRSSAIGYHASSLFLGSFVFADASSANPVASSVNHQFKIRASGGVVFYSDSLNTMGVTLNPGSGSWAVISDKHKKENFSKVDYESVLVNISKLKIKSWSYKSQSRRIRHIGPMAQDFYEVFHIGENNVTITTGDMDGVILSGIKGLNNRVNELENINQIDSLKFLMEELDDKDEMNKRLDAIEAKIKNN